MEWIDGRLDLVPEDGLTAGLRFELFEWKVEESWDTGVAYHGIVKNRIDLSLSN